MIYHTCSCGQCFTLERWRGLRSVGSQYVPATLDLPAMLLELRACDVCGSTRSVQIDPDTEETG